MGSDTHTSLYACGDRNPMALGLAPPIPDATYLYFMHRQPMGMLKLVESIRSAVIGYPPLFVVSIGWRKGCHLRSRAYERTVLDQRCETMHLNKKNILTCLCRSVCNIPVYIRLYMYVITSWNCDPLSKHTLRGWCVGFSERSDTEHVNVDLCKRIPAAHSELWACGFGFSSLHIMASGNREHNHGCWRYLVMEKQIMSVWRAHQHRRNCKCIFGWQAMDMHITCFIVAYTTHRPARWVQRMWPAWILPTCDRAWHSTKVRHKRTTKADVMVRCAAWYDHGSIVPLKMSAAVGISKKVWAAIQWNNWTRITWNIVMHALGPSPKKPLINHIYVYTHRGYEYISSCSA